MHLTQILCRFRPKKPKGNLWSGKHRLIKKVETKHLKELKSQYELEEQNMFYLRNPYLTLEESSGHAAHFKNHERWLEKWKAEKLKWRENVLLGDRLGFLKHNVPWD